ncbi:hypothetical protein A2U01_0105121, partial [Trifolium medium]|nr:hypothetical protein [Trifolium medium]
MVTVFLKERQRKSKPNTWGDLTHTQAGGAIRILGGIRTLIKERNRLNSHENHHL